MCTPCSRAVGDRFAPLERAARRRRSTRLDDARLVVHDQQHRGAGSMAGTSSVMSAPRIWLMCAWARRPATTPNAAATSAPMPPMKTGERAPIASEIAPRIGPPIGVVPMSSTVWIASTRPIISWSDRICAIDGRRGHEGDAAGADHRRDDRPRPRCWEPPTARASRTPSARGTDRDRADADGRRRATTQRADERADAERRVHERVRGVAAVQSLLDEEREHDGEVVADRPDDQQHRERDPELRHARDVLQSGADLPAPARRHRAPAGARPSHHAQRDEHRHVGDARRS